MVVFACLTTCFYAAAQVGEFTVTQLEGFDPSCEDVLWAKQNGPTDLDEAFQNYLLLNTPPNDGHLFAYKWKKGHHPLTKRAFILCLAEAAQAAGEEPLQGHGIRIGSTLKYLLRGVSFKTMKIMGRWASDAFHLYLRKHAQILALYLQVTPELHHRMLNDNLRIR
jgi:hypothetical protein